MKNKILITAFLSALSVIFSGCAIVGGIFKAGVGVGIFIVVAVVVLIIFLMSKMGKK